MGKGNNTTNLSMIEKMIPRVKKGRCDYVKSAKCTTRIDINWCLRCTKVVCIQRPIAMILVQYFSFGPYKPSKSIDFVFIVSVILILMQMDRLMF